MSSNDASPRMDYLNRIGLKSDPFLTPVAEQEISASGDISLFFRYYLNFTEPNFISGTDIDALGLNQHCFIFGAPGSGKTTTRLVLDAEYRRRFDETLVVTYLLGKDITSPPSIDEHGTRLARELSIDLTIQIMEHIAALHSLKEEEIVMLREQIRRGGSDLEWMISSMAKDLEEKSYKNAPEALASHAGLGMYWGNVDRYPVKYVGPSKVLDSLLLELTKQPAKSENKTAGCEAFWRAVDVGKMLGFKRIFILIDGVDASERTTEKMFLLIQPLLDLLNVAEKKHVYMKFFLPIELREKVMEYRKFLPNNLNSRIIDATMKWNPEALRQLLLQRFRAAGSRTIISLDALAEDDLESGLEKPVIEMANGSPRRMLAIVSELINAHITRKTEKIKINQDDWKKMENSADLLPAA